MATQITTTNASKPVAKAPVAAGSTLRAFVPNTLDEAWRLSAALAQSGMLPKAYGQDPSKVMVGMLAGAEVGLTPFAALQSIAVINGNPTMWGDGMLGLVEGSGLLEDFEETDDGKVATCRAVRRGRATPIIRSFSVDDAKTAGLAGKQGPWQQYPKRMRQLRARSFCLRDGFADVLKGIKSAEEVRDYAPMDGGMLGHDRPALTAAMIEDQARGDSDIAPDDTVTEGRVDTEMGEAFTNDLTVESLCAAFAAAATADALGDIQVRAGEFIDGLSVEDKQTVFAARNARRDVLLKGKV